MKSKMLKAIAVNSITGANNVWLMNPLYYSDFHIATFIPSKLVDHTEEYVPHFLRPKNTIRCSSRRHGRRHGVRSKRK